MFHIRTPQWRSWPLDRLQKTNFAWKPPYPYLFDVVADVLRQMILSEAIHGVLRHNPDPWYVGPVLHYADDTLILHPRRANAYDSSSTIFPSPPA